MKPFLLVMTMAAFVCGDICAQEARTKGFGTHLGVEKLGCEPQAISPIHHVKKGTPPTIIFHGTADTTVPYSTAEGFAAQMKKLGNRCELVGYEGQPHGFFNAARYDETLAAADAFLVSLGWLAATGTK